VDEDLRPLGADKSLDVWAGLDLGLRHDATALVVVARDGERIVLVDHKVFVPEKGETLDIAATAEQALRTLAERFRVAGVAFDPWMSIDLAQRLRKASINMVEVTQTANNQGPMANQLIDLIRQKQLMMYPSKELRLAVSKTLIIESSRGYRLGKVVGSARIDPIVALSMACLLAGREESVGSAFTVEDLFSGELMFDSRNPDQYAYGVPVQRSRPPSFAPMARPEAEEDPLAPKHPGVTFWDFVDARGLDPNDPIIPTAHRLALEQYKRDMAAYRAAKAAEKAAAADAEDKPDLVRS
jgi:hypothetical protein